MRDFQIGDVVRLKTSQTEMVITAFHADTESPFATTFTCCWITSDGRAQSGKYPREALVMVTPQQP